MIVPFTSLKHYMRLIGVLDDSNRSKTYRLLLNFFFLGLNIYFVLSTLWFILFNAELLNEFTTSFAYMILGLLDVAWYSNAMWQRKHYDRRFNELHKIIEKSEFEYFGCFFLVNRIFRYIKIRMQKSNGENILWKNGQTNRIIDQSNAFIYDENVGAACCWFGYCAITDYVWIQWPQFNCFQTKLSSCVSQFGLINNCYNKKRHGFLLHSVFRWIRKHQPDF